MTLGVRLRTLYRRVDEQDARLLVSIGAIFGVLMGLLLATAVLS